MKNLLSKSKIKWNCSHYWMKNKMLNRYHWRFKTNLATKLIKLLLKLNYVKGLAVKDKIFCTLFLRMRNNRNKNPGTANYFSNLCYRFAEKLSHLCETMKRHTRDIILTMWIVLPFLNPLPCFNEFDSWWKFWPKQIWRARLVNRSSGQT